MKRYYELPDELLSAGKTEYIKGFPVLLGVTGRDGRFGERLR